MASPSKNLAGQRLGLVRDDSVVPQRPRPAEPDGAGRPGPFHNLPGRPGGFVGRHREVAEVEGLLTRCRLVTVTGLGGMGKTSLGLQVAARSVPAHPDGVWLTELAGITDQAGPTRAVAAAFPWADEAAAPATREGVADLIGDRQLLLVLDNCEHLVDACAHLTEFLLSTCPGLRILATSREPLGILDEQTWTLGPLSLHDSGDVSAESLVTCEAGELFVRRATAVSPRFRCTDDVAPAIAEICRRLDGIPLAIELAAARLASMSASELLQRLDDGIGLLNIGSRTALPRHQAMVAALDWSQDLLTPSEAVLLRRLTVFSGFTLEAAEDVCADEGVDRGHVVDLVASLVNKSLVVADAHAERVRFRLLDTVRIWQGAKLHEAGEAPAVNGRHLTWCLAVAEGADEKPGVHAATHADDQIVAEHDNLRSALDWARAAGEAEVGVRLATALIPFWRAGGHIEEGARWLEWAALASEGCPIELQARVLRGAGLLQGLLGDIASALPLLEQSSALSAASTEDGSDCNCNPMTVMFRNPRQVLPDLEKRMVFLGRAGDTTGMLQILRTVAQAHMVLGESAEARLHFEECVRLGRQEADGEALRGGLFGLGRVALLCGDLATVELNAAEARASAELEGDLDDTSTALGLLGDLARARGNWTLARELLADAERLARALASPLTVARAVYLKACLAESDATLGAAEVRSLFEKSLLLGRAAGAPGFHEVRCFIGIGSATQSAGDPSAATGYLLEALEKAQALGDVQGSAHAFDRLSTLARLQGKTDEASMLAHRGLVLHHRIGELAGVVSSLELRAGLVTDAGRLEVATRLLGAAQAAREGGGYARSVTDQARHEAVLAELRAGLELEVFATAWAEGVALDLEEAVQYAVRGRGPRGRGTSGWDSLTPAERQVVRLVAEGLTNAEVGQRLFISRRTVGNHLSNVYDKVNVRSRRALISGLAGLEL